MLPIDSLDEVDKKNVEELLELHRQVLTNEDLVELLNTGGNEEANTHVEVEKKQL